MVLYPQILIVDDDQGVRRSLQLLLRGHGYRVRAYADSRALAKDPEARFASLLVADYCMPESDGFEVIRGLRETGWKGTALLITGFGSTQLVESALLEGFDAVLDKPVRPNLLLNAAGHAIGHSAAS